MCKWLHIVFGATWQIMTRFQGVLHGVLASRILFILRDLGDTGQHEEHGYLFTSYISLPRTQCVSQTIPMTVLHADAERNAWLYLTVCNVFGAQISHALRAAILENMLTAWITAHYMSCPNVNTVTCTSRVCRATEVKCNPLQLSSPFFLLVMISPS